MVGRLVEQQQVRLAEELGGQRHAHAPAAGEGLERALLRLVVETEAGEDAGGPRRRRMRLDLDQASPTARYPAPSYAWIWFLPAASKCANRS